MNKVNTAKRVLLHNFAIQEYLITHSSLNTHSLMTQRRIQADQMRLETPRILQPLEVKPTYEDNSLDQMNYRFAASLGQYLMFVYLFGIGDRHNDNIMLNNRGYFHIDYGHILGHYKHKLGIARETHSFLFTQSITIMAIGGESHPNFKVFMDNAMACYRVVRENVTLFYALFELLRESGVDEIVDDNDTLFLIRACRLDCMKEE